MMLLEKDAESGEDVPVLDLILEQHRLQHRAQDPEVGRLLVVFDGLLEHGELLRGEALLQQRYVVLGLIQGAILPEGGRRGLL